MIPIEKEQNSSETKDKTLQIYPNPTTGILNINYPNEETRRIRITSISGTVVLEKQKRQPNEVLNLEHLPQGVYVVEILLDDKTVRKLVILQ